MTFESAEDKKLIRWLEGDLQGEELRAFESSKYFEDYQKILKATEQIDAPILDKDTVFANIQNKIKEKPQTRVFTLRRSLMMVAAIAVLAFAVVSILPSGIDIDTGFGEQLAHSLPDGSNAFLNSNSTLTYNEGFERNRKLKLEGEAFFEVEKGKTFTVETELGNVMVLGTSFNVFVRDDVFSVSCKTGKVQVSVSGKDYTLVPGNNVRFKNNKVVGQQGTDIDKIDSWRKGETYFKQAPLNEVILSISNHYGKSIELPKRHELEIFTGSYVHSDFKKAVKMVFSPMGITYSIDNNGDIIVDE